MTDKWRERIERSTLVNTVQNFKPHDWPVSVLRKVVAYVSGEMAKLEKDVPPK